MAWIRREIKTLGGAGKKNEIARRVKFLESNYFALLSARNHVHSSDLCNKAPSTLHDSMRHIDLLLKNR